MRFESLEDRRLLAVVWANRGADNFESAFGAGNAEVARNIVDHAIADWNGIITDFNYQNVGTPGNAPMANDLQVTISATDLGQFPNTVDFVAATDMKKFDAEGKIFEARILLDDNASGQGWYFDSTPANDSEFSQTKNAFASAAPTGLASTRKDLLDSALHELGHVVGIGTTAEQHLTNSFDLMNDGTPVGQRRFISDADLFYLDNRFPDYAMNVRANTWQNPRDRLDVNADGFVVPGDVLKVINYIAEDDNDRRVPAPTTSFSSWNNGYYVDVNGDGWVTPIDALQVINFLNTGIRPEGESSSPFINLGTVDFQRVDDLNLSPDGAWFELKAARTGVLTIEALFANANGNVDLDVYASGNLFSPLASSNSATNNERVELSTAVGQSYFVHVAGANPNVDFVVTNLIAVNGTTVDVAGTSAADTFVFTAGTNYAISVNGVAYSYPASSVSQVAFHGGGGSDSIVVTGSSARDTAYIYPKSLTVVGSGYQVTTDSLETQRVYSGGGSDYSYFYDSAGNDTFGGQKGAVYMYGSGYANYANNFYGVYAYASNGYDSTYYYDTVGNDTFLSASTYSYMYGSGYMHYARGFDSVLAYATSGGYDQAYFYDSSSNDYLYGRSTYAYISGGGTFRYGYGFDSVYAYGYYGGTNTYDVSGVNYYFARYGTWQAV